MTRALMPLADGVEEMEAVILIDTFRRAGWNVTSAGIAGRQVTASRGVRLLADALWQDVDSGEFDALILPGGGDGTRALAAHDGVLEAVRCFVLSERYVGAICAAPLVLQAAGVLEGRRVTCHPSVRGELKGAKTLEDRVVVDNRLVTSQGPGTAFEFALTLIRLISGNSKAEDVAAAMVLALPFTHSLGLSNAERIPGLHGREASGFLLQTPRLSPSEPG